MDLTKKLSILVFLFCVVISLKNRRAATDSRSVLEEESSAWRNLGGDEWANSDGGEQERLLYDFYTQSFPSAENIVRSAKLISLGAKIVVVPGLYTISRLPIYRTAFYGRFEMWDVAEDLAIHRKKFNEEERRPDAVVVFGDYYSAYEALDGYSGVAGRDLMVCCGSGGGDYNMDLQRMRGAEEKDILGWIAINRGRVWDYDNVHMLYHIFTDLDCPYLSSTHCS